MERARSSRSSHFAINGVTALLKNNGRSIFPKVKGSRKGKDDSGWYVPIINGVKSVFGFLKEESINLVAARYDHGPLEALLQGNFGHTTIGHVKSDFLITACSTSGCPRAFTKDSDSSIKLWELGRATSAAPTYFKPFPMPSENINLPSSHLVDGGIWMNNPSILVAGRLMKKENVSPKNLHILSMGTGLSMMSRDLPKVYSGKLTSVGPLIDALMTSNSIGNHQALSYVLGPENYARINPRMNEAYSLDDVSDDTSSKLENLAKGSMDAVKDVVLKWEEPIRKRLEKQV